MHVGVFKPALQPSGAVVLLAILLCTVCPCSADDGQVLGSVAAFEADLGPGATSGSAPGLMTAALQNARHTLNSAKRTVNALLALGRRGGHSTSDAEVAAFQPEAEPGNLKESCLDTDLAAAEAVYQTNMKMRAATEKTWPSGGLSLLREVILVPTYPCALERRIGNLGDGGKWLCRRHHNMSTKPLALSIGCHGDTSFESSFSEVLHGFSHTIDFTLSQSVQDEMAALRYMKFYNLGLTGTAEMESRENKNVFRTVPALLNETGHRFFDIFKIDCEGCEIAVVDDMVSMYSRKDPPFGQIQMEIHFTNTKHPQLVGLVKNLEGLGYRFFHVEPNPNYVEGYELAFIHELFVKPRP